MKETLVAKLLVKAFFCKILSTVGCKGAFFSELLYFYITSGNFYILELLFVFPSHFDRLLSNFSFDKFYSQISSKVEALATVDLYLAKSGASYSCTLIMSTFFNVQ